MKWRAPDDCVDIECGERVALIVFERPFDCAPKRHRIIMLTACETGWYSDDETFTGYGLHDGVAWTYEKEILAQTYQEPTP